jgi:penicillin-binding protein activator
VKKYCMLTAVVLSGALLISCASTPSGSSVQRIDAGTQTDLSGYWNDTDVRTVSDSLVTECVNAPAISGFAAAKKRPPVVIVGSFRNQSDEHIDTSIIAKKFEASLINSGRVDFVASSAERSEIRGERDDQQQNASDKTAKSVGNETGADFMLIGAVKTIIDSAGGVSTRTYYVTAELVDIETNRKLWVGEDSSIKKLIKRAAYKM